MYNEKSKENLKKGRRITSETAVEMQNKGAEVKRQRRTLWEMLVEEDENGTIADVGHSLLMGGDGNLQFKMLELYTKLKDKETARKNGELEPKAFIYERMNFNEVKPK